MDLDLFNKSVYQPFVHQPEDQPTCDFTSSKEADEQKVEQQYLIFRVARERFALEITTIREITRIPPIIELPRAPANIAGAVSFRGEIVGIFDLHQRLALDEQPEFSRAARLIVAHTTKGQVGILVDSVIKVVKQNILGKELLESMETRIFSQFVSGTVSCGDEDIPVLNLSEILACEQAL